MLSLWNDATQGVQVFALSGSAGVYSSHTLVILDQLIALFETVAAEEGWQPGDALRQSRSQSIYFAVEVQGKLAGGIQLTLPDAEGILPCFALWSEVVRPALPQRSAHISVLALDPVFRGQPLLFWRIVVEMWRYCVGQGIATLFIEVTPRVLPLYRRLGWSLTIKGDLRSHWGEDCYLCTLGVADVAAALLQRAEHSIFYKQIVAQAFRITVSEEDEKPALLVREIRSAYSYVT